MKPIGGYFELETMVKSTGPILQEGVLVNSGRNALEYILRSIGSEKIGTIYLPLYTCEVVLEPLQKLNLKYDFYHINCRLEIEDYPALSERDWIIANNYFGIKDKYIEKLTAKYKNQIIVDNSQAWYAPVLEGQKSFFSPRKFVGIPDGGIAYCDNNIILNKQDSSDDRISHLVKRYYSGPEAGYEDFHINSKKLVGLPLMRMSELTKSMLETIDFERIKKIRKENYDSLRNVLESYNLLKTPESTDIACPMVYPFLTKDSSLRSRLIENKIFVAKYWPNVTDWCPEKGIERVLADEIIPLPIDQRYNSSDLNRIIRLTKSHCEELILQKRMKPL